MGAEVKTGDLQLFRTNNNAYKQFIEELTSIFTVPGEKYGNIRVTKRDDEVTKVIIKDGDKEVSFIYRNRDLYIIGFVVKSIFYVDKEVNDDHGNKIRNKWSSVIGTKKVESLSYSFSYPFIMPQGENTVLDIGKLGYSLQQLYNVDNRKERPDIIRYHLAPFTVAFCEAIRFPIIVEMVQGAIRQIDGKVKLSSVNLVKRYSLGHPSQRTEEYALNVHSLMLNWGTLSDRAGRLYSNPSKDAPEIKLGKFTLNVGKPQLNNLLAVVVSSQFDAFRTSTTRRKRDLESILDHAILRHPALLEQQSQINRIGYQGNMEQPYSRQSTAGIASITQNPDLVGALHLLSVGLLYLYGKKMNVPIATNQRDLDLHEAYGVAVDLMDRIECFLGSSGLELELDFEERMQFQGELTRALVHGEQVEPILTKLLDSKFPVKHDSPGVEKVIEQLSKALASESGLLETNNFEKDECFHLGQEVKFPN